MSPTKNPPNRGGTCPHRANPASWTPWSEYKCGEVIPSGTDLGSYVSTIRYWLESCTRNHPRCCPSASPPPRLPTRVLELGASEDAVHLIDTRTTQPRPLLLPYMALSHCWGSGPLPLTLLATPLPQTHQVAALPPSFRDAIRLARALSIRYLWIDSLCILQDCPSDWESESSQMLQYYSGAFLVLAASRAASPASGFLRAREPCGIVRSRRRPACSSAGLVGAAAAGGAAGVISARFSPHLASELDLSSARIAPLDTRGWALQERLSARRVVHFYDAEMVWECEGETRCECGRLSDRHRLLESGRLPLKMRVAQGMVAAARSGDARSVEEAFGAWVDLVQQYTRRALTKDEDKLPAIGGLARMFSEGRTLGRYLAGVWEGALLPCLLWRVEDARRVRRPRTYVAPSWSWAGLVGRVNWKCVDEYRLRFVAQVLDCRAVCGGTDAFGRVESGMLRIRTKTWETRAEYQPAGGSMALTSGDNAYFDVNGRSRRNSYRLYRTVKCVIIAEGSSGPGLGAPALLALVVEEFPEKESAPVYKRTGLAILDPRRLRGAAEETVIIM